MENQTLNLLRQQALNIFQQVIKSVDTNKVVKEAVSLDGPRLTIKDQLFDLEKSPTPIYSIAIGKGAYQMAAALDEVLGNRLSGGVIAGPIEEHKLDMSQRASQISKRWQMFEGGHPVPNEASIAAARASFELLNRANQEQALVIFLISGGGSAMLELPRDESITLEDLRETNRILVTCGAAIGEINAVRRAISAVKGGGLSRYASNTKQISLIISDTETNEDFNVASGPTLSPPDGSPNAISIIDRYDLAKRLPASVMRTVESQLKERAEKRVDHSYYVLLSNDHAIRSAVESAEHHGLIVKVANDLIEQHITEGCDQLLSRVQSLRKENSSNSGICLVSGGEFACPVRGSGMGGRNSETVLRLAISIDERMKSPNTEETSWSHIVALSGGTDGIDGNSPAAGAIADETSVKRGKDLNLDALDYLNRSDSYSFFNTIGDAIITGKTGTNVRDIRIIIAQ
jgi:glycerate 2-kinase